MKADNPTNYENSAVVSYYNAKDKLSLAEKTILEIIREKTLDSMIDIGVGAGRTTHAFARIFKQYVGIDYSNAMVKAARKKFAANNCCTFLHCDARDMKVFPSESFDFMLFSFNGIDCVSHSDRQIILAEVKRIGKAGSYFAFSTHNLYNVPVLYSFQMPRNPFRYLRELYRFRKVRQINPPLQEILDKDFVSLFDGDIDFNAEYLYYKPERQILELTEHGFVDIEVFSHKSGKKVKAGTPWEKITDPWLYFLCRNSK